VASACCSGGGLLSAARSLPSLGAGPDPEQVQSLPAMLLLLWGALMHHLELRLLDLPSFRPGPAPAISSRSSPSSTP